MGGLTSTFIKLISIMFRGMLFYEIIQYLQAHELGC